MVWHGTVCMVFVCFSDPAAFLSEPDEVTHDKVVRSHAEDAEELPLTHSLQNTTLALTLASPW